MFYDQLPFRLRLAPLRPWDQPRRPRSTRRVELILVLLSAMVGATGCSALQSGGSAIGPTGVIPKEYKVTEKDRNDGFPTASEAGL
jgi:hypothetical protein